MHVLDIGFKLRIVEEKKNKGRESERENRRKIKKNFFPTMSNDRNLCVCSKYNNGCNQFCVKTAKLCIHFVFFYRNIAQSGTFTLNTRIK